MARTVAEAEAIVAAEAASTGIVQVGFVRRWSPNAAVLRSFVVAGDLGEVYYAKATCLRAAGNPGGWFADKSVSGGGPLIDVGVHFIDIAWWLMGAPAVTSVSGWTSDRIGNRGNIETLSRWKSSDYDASKNSVEDLAGALVRFANGAVLVVDTSYSLHGRNDIGVKLFGDQGGAELEPELRVFREAHDTILEITPVIDSLTFDLEPAFQNEIDGFVRAAQGLEPSIAPAAHGLEITRIVTAIYESAEAGREIAF
jgi:predicted dehydrogenase